MLYSGLNENGSHGLIGKATLADMQLSEDLVACGGL